MGCNIHVQAERQSPDGTWEGIPDLSPLNWRSYNLYGWLAGVRNYAAMQPLAAHRGIPEDASAATLSGLEWDDEVHSQSWVLLSELIEFDYDALCEDRRCNKQIGPNTSTGAATCAPGEGVVQSYRKFLGEKYFAELERLKAAGAERLVFWFDC